MKTLTIRWMAAAMAGFAMGCVHAQTLQLPVEGRWFVLQAGDTPNVNHHMAVQAQWYGVDLGKVGGDSGRALSRPQPSKVEDFFSWGQVVRAPHALGDKDARRPAGNHVVIKVAPERYLVLTHFQRGSITVTPGQRVTAGQLLGRCGNSGNTDFPHVHLHLQDQPVLNQGTGVNPVFAGMDAELTGRPFQDVTWPLIRGLFVSNREGKAP